MNASKEHFTRTYYYAFYSQNLIQEFVVVFKAKESCEQEGEISFLCPGYPESILQWLTWPSQLSRWCRTASRAFLHWHNFHVILSKMPENNWSRENQSKFMLGTHCAHLCHQPRCHWTLLHQCSVIRSWLIFPLIFDWHATVPWWIGRLFSFSGFSFHFI